MIDEVTKKQIQDEAMKQFLKLQITTYSDLKKEIDRIKDGKIPNRKHALKQLSNELKKGLIILEKSLLSLE